MAGMLSFINSLYQLNPLTYIPASPLRDHHNPVIPNPDLPGSVESNERSAAYHRTSRTLGKAVVFNNP